LSGTVNSRFERRHAEDIAESVTGVVHVQNNLRVQQQGAMSGMGGASGAGAGQPSGATSGPMASTASGGSTSAGSGSSSDQPGAGGRRRSTTGTASS